MAQIMHGRRSGKTKSAPKEGKGVDMTGGGMILPNGTDLNKVTILSKADWDRIQYQINRRIIEKDRVKDQIEAKEALHRMSVDQVKLWTNTIEGQRIAKLQNKGMRDEKLEQERHAMDLEEAKIQAKQRKDAIDKAKTQQYYQTDRVKGFHSALLLTEVLKEREAQLELRKLKEQAVAGQDNVWIEQARRTYEESILQDQEAARERITGYRDCADFQKAQIKQHMNAEERTRVEDEIEGEELKKLATQYEREKKRLADIQAVEAQRLLADNFKQRADMRRLREVQQDQEEEEDEECRMFALAKRKMMKLRAQKEKELHTEKLNRLDKIRDKLSGQMQQALDDEDDRIRRAVEEREAKRDAEERGKAEWVKKTYQDMAENRHEQMKYKEDKAREARKQELEAAVVKREADALFAANEEEKRNRKYGERKSLQQTHLGQAALRRDKEQQAQDEQLALDKKNLGLVELEEKQFQEYAQRVISHAKKGGRNTYPLHRAAKEGAGGGLGPVFPGKGGIRPSYITADVSGIQLPCYQRDSTNETKDLVHGKHPTAKRLGFGW